MKMRGIHWLAWLLLVIGGINWGLIGFFQYNLVGEIFGSASTLTRIIYSLVGLSAIDVLVAMLGKRK